MSAYCQFLVVLALFGVQSHGKPNHHINDLDLECIKDILIVWDNSRSVGSNFKYMVNFLENFVNSRQLDVRKNGTHIALNTFSDKEHTKKLLGFGEKVEKEDLDYYISNIKQKNIQGGVTLTGRALCQAAQIFKKHDPKNHRPQFNDVIIILTDGKPTGYARENRELYKQYNVPGEPELANHCADVLRKERGIKIIGVAVGPFRMQTMDNIKRWSDVTFDAKFDGLNNILNSIVDESCIGKACKCPNDRSITGYLPPGAQTLTIDFDIVLPKDTTFCNVKKPEKKEYGVGKYTEKYGYGPNTCVIQIEVKECLCSAVSKSLAYLGPNERTVEVNWEIPKPNCDASIAKTIVRPDVTPGHRFTSGVHSVNYEYEMNAGFSVKCSVDIEVKECSCSAVSKSLAYIDPNQRTVEVKWDIPKPACDAKIKKNIVRPDVTPGHRFTLGVHHVSYEYEMEAGFSFTCGVDIEVKVIPCKRKDYNPATHVCCCGELVKKIPNGECCGSAMYEKSREKCCDYSNVVGKSDNCPGTVNAR